MIFQRVTKAQIMLINRWFNRVSTCEWCARWTSWLRIAGGHLRQNRNESLLAGPEFAGQVGPEQKKTLLLLSVIYEVLILPYFILYSRKNLHLGSWI